MLLTGSKNNILASDFFLINENMPISVRGFTLFNSKNSIYQIILNCKNSYKSMLRTLFHELLHIFNDDFNHQHDVNTIEIDTHCKI